MQNEGRDEELIILAIKTLGAFDFRGHALHEMVRDCAHFYLEDDNQIVRKAAAVTSSHLLAQDPVCYQVGFRVII
jgi:FKBP12-rapamycin complex-associated protein